MRRTQLLIVCLSFLLSTLANADTHVTFGSGSAVVTSDWHLTFNNLKFQNNGAPLSDYQEDSVFVRTSGDSFSSFGPGVQPVFDPFHTGVDPSTCGFYYPYGGSYEWTVVESARSIPIYALEFLYGNGWTTGDIYGVPWGNSQGYIEWKTVRNGLIVGSGTIGPDPILPVGTVVGFWDNLGFDQLQMRCMIKSSADPNLQALALDDLVVQTTPVPEPSAALAVGVGVFALALKKGRTKA